MSSARCPWCKGAGTTDYVVPCSHCDGNGRIEITPELRKEIIAAVDQKVGQALNDVAYDLHVPAAVVNKVAIKYLREHIKEFALDEDEEWVD